MEEVLKFEHYEVLRKPEGGPWELGRGAMGVTYKALDTSLRNFVALKVIGGAHLQSPMARERFLREARSAAALRHPNVAAVYHLGVEGDVVFYAMEFLDGETVEQRMKRDGAVDPLRALEIADQVCRALAAAEERALVHRDIKPANLMLVRDEDEGLLVKVIDFGLAKAAEGSEDAATLTVAGFLGTPHFASPEQLEEKPLDTRSDLYSLGATLWYMLAGKTPFSGSLAQVMSQHLSVPPPFESLVGLPEPLVALLGRLMAKDPAARPQSAAAARAEIISCAAQMQSAGTAEPSEGSSGLPAVVEQEFETAVLEEASGESEVPDFSVGSQIAGRFEISGEGTPCGAGVRFPARSLEGNGDAVILQVLSAEQIAQSSALVEIESGVGSLASLSEPALVEIRSFESVGGQCFFVLEPLTGTSLLDELRARKVIPFREALDWLQPIARALDALTTSGIACPDLVPHEIILSEDRESGTRMPKIFPLRLTGYPGLDPGATVVDSAVHSLRSGEAFGGRPGAEAAFACASLAYEILGGVRGPSGTIVPVAALSEDGNQAVRKALDAGKSTFESATAFVTELAADASAYSAPSREIADQSAQDAGSQPLLPGHETATPKPQRRLLLFVMAGLGVLLVIGTVGGGVLLFNPQSKPEPQGEPELQPESTASLPSPEKFLAEGLAEPDALVALPIFAEGMAQFPDDTSLREAASATLQKLPNLEPPPDPQALLALVPKLKEVPREPALEFWLGKSLLDVEPKEGFRLLASASEKNHPGAALLLADCHQRGHGTVRDERAYVEALRHAAQLDEPRALNRLGDVTKKGIPGILNPDPEEAFRLFSRARELGFLDAQGNLGVLVREGLGTGNPPDEAAAAVLFREGAEQGNALCMFFYALCLESGSGVESDPAAGREWFIKSAKAGLPPAIDWCRHNGISLE